MEGCNFKRWTVPERAGLPWGNVVWDFGNMRTVNPLEGRTQRLNNWKGKDVTEVGKGMGRERKAAKGMPRWVPSFPRFKSEFVFVWRLLEYDENLKPPVSLFSCWIRSVRHFTLPQNKQKVLWRGSEAIYCQWRQSWQTPTLTSQSQWLPAGNEHS